MLTSFPTELAVHIVRLAVLSSFLPHLYHDRLATLTSLCMVSSKLRSVAQPILFEVVQVKSHEAVESFLEVVEADKAPGARVRSVRVEGHDDDDDDDDKTPVELDVEWLKGFSRLRRLVFTDARIFASDPLSLLVLNELSLAQPSLDDKLFDMIAFPALQALHIELIQEHKLPPIPFSLFAQLEHFSCAWSDIDNDGGALGLVTTPQEPSRTSPISPLTCSTAFAVSSTGLTTGYSSSLPFTSLPNSTPPPLHLISTASKSPSFRDCLSTLTSRNIAVVSEEAPHPFYEFGGVLEGEQGEESSGIRAGGVAGAWREREGWTGK
ncbi:hypothetical protein JCM8547_000798 [Rhodosporidiobolus lusitaniae]